ncbi:nuclear transport factor 2 family protein [Amycolatopsis sp. 195334CR]|uniref:nuclear transport factor 2 family protein n=1 Tax=Amycolatopsis sp. 195334CR TaxID=2814588 RepID=UPI001A8DC5AD|nr:nuclear transport factor 2 family protein [Amycolatopsis sp. 195334CR]MBN6037786.1 nuclear transport factor 2 family protein [Amycolatopsis sp. 195334CR]
METVAEQFNARINAHDLTGLGRLMSDDHRFVDTDGNVVAGKRACLEAWSGFFVAFPEYRNVFESVTTDGARISITGHSICPGHPDLQGPARWTAVLTADNLVAEWHVHQV